MSLLLAGTMSPPPLPRLSAVSFHFAVGAGAACGLMVPNATKTQLGFGQAGVAAGVTKKYDIVVSEPAIVSLEPFDWPPPECCEEIAIILGTPIAFEDQTANRLPWNPPRVGMAMSTRLTVTFKDGLITIASPSGVSAHTFDLTKRAAAMPMGVFVCLRASSTDAVAAITESGTASVAGYIG